MTREDAGLEGPTVGRMADAVRNQDAIFRDTFPGMLGVKVVSVTDEVTTGEMAVGPNVRHPGGSAHGGAIAGFGDTLAAWATMARLSDGEGFTTIEFKSNFVAGVADGTLTGEATVAHRGRRTIVVEVRISSAGKLVAIMIVTQAVLGGRGEINPDS
ncbi:MAG TPA: PaaI family thioesterase [Actinomycetota bacterium]